MESTRNQYFDKVLNSSVDIFPLLKMESFRKCYMSNLPMDNHDTKIRDLNLKQ